MAIEYVIKRDGRKVPYDKTKIKNAIEKAVKDVGESYYNLSENLIPQIEARIEMGPVFEPTVEYIQDLVEEVLMDHGYKSVAKSYILYRKKRSDIREMKSSLMETLKNLTVKSSKDNDLKRENGNINADSAMGMMLKYGSESAKLFNLLHIIPEEFASAHVNGDIHIHDLDFYTLTETCCQIDLKKLFDNGFTTGHGTIRKPNSIRTYAALACIVIQADQNDQHFSTRIVSQ